MSRGTPTRVAMAATDPHTSSADAPADNARVTWARNDAAGAPSATRVAIRTSSISRSSRELLVSPATRASRNAEMRPGAVSLRPSNSAGTAIGVGSGTPGTISNAIRAGGSVLVQQFDRSQDPIHGLSLVVSWTSGSPRNRPATQPGTTHRRDHSGSGDR